MAATQTRAAHADQKGRVTLGRKHAGKLYRVEETAQGKVVLTPVVEIPAEEAWLYHNPTAFALLTKGIEDAAAGRVSDAGSFVDYAHDDID